MIRRHRPTTQRHRNHKTKRNHQKPGSTSPPWRPPFARCFFVCVRVPVSDCVLVRVDDCVCVSDRVDDSVADTVWVSVGSVRDSEIDWVVETVAV